MEVQLLKAHIFRVIITLLLLNLGLIKGTVSKSELYSSLLQVTEKKKITIMPVPEQCR